MRCLAPLAALLLLPVACSSAARADPPSDDARIAEALAARQDTMVATLQRWVELNTGSRNTAGLQEFASELASPLEELSLEVTINDGVALDQPGHEGEPTGPLLLATGGSQDEAALRLLLVGHMDTVFEPDSPFQHFEQDPLDPDRATGPGVVDMKGGLVVLVEMLRALKASGDLGRAHWTVLLNSDEEIGSLGSRPVIEREAALADYGFVFEPSRANGSMTRSRSGIGQYHFAVEGRAAHSGSAHAQGRSAILELAQKVVRLEALTDYERAVTVNVGIISGGAKRNAVPGYAEAWIDLRYPDPDSGLELQRAVEGIGATVYVDDTSTTMWGLLHRPAKPASAAVDELLSRHAAICADLGVELPPPEHSGGGTDGSIMAGQGLPTVDTLGPVGSWVHTEREYIVLSSLSQRAAAAAILLRRLIDS